MTTTQDVLDAHRDFLAADREWSLCLIECFGKRNAGDMRYMKEGEGIHGSELNRCYLDFVAAREHWYNVHNLCVQGA